MDEMMEFERWIKIVLKKLNSATIEDTTAILILAVIQEVKINRRKANLEKLLNNLEMLGFSNLIPSQQQIQKWIELGEIK
ncbi:hypothetical protein DRP05_09460 [Archaeoglobales archaeon]|nr:MAG: hypothetical protein DRP05_09460 [Archaeoglobales archaeon]